VSEQHQIGTVLADWRTLAACRGLDPDLFFPARGDSFTARNAQAVCAACPVAEQCLEFAIEVGETEGIWGGLSGRQLRQERQRRSGGVRTGPKPQPIKHGTHSGYAVHLKRGEQPCQLCKDARATYQQATRPSRKKQATDAA
jgi:WhiB family redox-sensing transcriptional regulator